MAHFRWNTSEACVICPHDVLVLRFWIIQLKWPTRQTASSPCFPPVLMLSMCTLGPMAFSSTPLFCCYVYIQMSQFYQLYEVDVWLNRKVKKGSLLIDSSTIDPAVSKEMASAAEKMGAVFMDAPVSGGQPFLLIINISCTPKGLHKYKYVLIWFERFLINFNNP